MTVPTTSVLGIDIGGSGIKGAPVDLDAGEFAGERVRIETPQPANVTNVVTVFREVVAQLPKAERLGVTFPGVVLDGVTRTAANLDPSWVGAPAASLFAEATGVPVTVLNDADAAGIAEMHYGAGRGQDGLVVMVTFGTGIGSALFNKGVLVPNTEFGHLEIRGKDAELRASDRARSEHDLSWTDWAERVEEYLRHLEMLLSPNLFIIGGGVSRKADNFLPHVKLDTPVVPATLQNQAGIIGAALAARG
jgi:polyphosphate glucokinase